MVLTTSFLPSMLTIAPLKWSPFFSDTSSALSATALQISNTNTNDQTFFNTSSLSFFGIEGRKLAHRSELWVSAPVATSNFHVSRTASAANRLGISQSGGE